MMYPGSLHNHSEYSNIRLRDSISKLDDLVWTAANLGHSVVAVTDHDCLSSHLKAEKVYKKVKEKYPHFKMIRGNEIYLCRNDLTSENFVRGEDDYFHFVLLAKDAIGHEQLREISTRAWHRSYIARNMRRVPTYYNDLIEIILENPGHLIGSTACLGGYIPKQILRYHVLKDKSILMKIQTWLLDMNRLFGEGNFYLELQPSYNKEQQIVNTTLVQLSKQLNIPYIITNDAHYLLKEDREIHKAYLNSQNGDREVDAFYETTYLMTTEQLLPYFEDILSPEEVQYAFDNIQKIRDMCEDYSLMKSLRIPELSWKTPGYISTETKDKYFKLMPELLSFYTSDYNGDKVLAELIIERVRDDITLQNERTYYEINDNLRIVRVSSEVNKVHWSSYFLNLQGIIDTCWEAGSIVGPARGSGTGFILLYVLGITQINPLREKTQMFSWRFLNPDRVSVLDVDFDIEGGRRPQVLQAFRDKYGEDRVANVITFGTEGSKSAIQTACFKKGTLINTTRGLKSVENIISGDEVYTSNGVESVIQPTHRNYKGSFYTIKNDCNLMPITCTENHQFLVYPNGRKKQAYGSVCNYQPCQLFDPQNNLVKEFISVAEASRYYADIYNGSYSSMKKYKKANGFYIKHIKAMEVKNGEIQWLAADKIHQTDKLLSFIDLTINKELPIIHFSQEEQNPYKKYCNYIKENIIIDKNLCELLGIYLAEGNINTDLRGITFTISQEEKYFKNRIIYLIKECFGISEENITLIQKKDSQGLSIQINSTPLGRFVWKYFNEEEHRVAINKKVPEKFKKIPPEIQLSIVKGFYLGDGYGRKRENNSYESKLTTISSQLVIDLWQILARNKCRSTFSVDKCDIKNSYEHNIYNLMVYGKNGEQLYNIKYLNELEKDFEIIETTEYIYYQNKPYYLSNILSIEKTDNINEIVYCLSVPSEHFIINNIITHNCRGLEIDNDIAMYISSLIPADRGMVRTLKQCYYGDKENGFAPVPAFVQQMDQYPELWAVAQKIEGLVCRSGIHAGGVIFVDEPFTKSVSLMRAPDGTVVTAYDLHDSEDCSLIKYDSLSVEAMDKIHNCIDLICDHGYAERKATLKETYESIVGIYTLERDDPKMWEMVWNHEINSLFQMEKQSGIQGIALTKPKSVDELAVLNSVIRLMAQEKGAEQPLNKFARFKNDISLWYDEMDRFGLTDGEQELLKPILELSSGICESQEKFMQLVQIPECGGFSLTWADSLRKSIAKKNPAQFDALEKEYFEEVNRKGLSKPLCNYVWKVLVSTSKGYGFNASHTVAYSLVALQEMNLAFKYPIIFWNCACAISDSGGQDASADYNKIANTIGRMIQSGINVKPPDINLSSYTFVPNAEDNSILFGLKGLINVGIDVINQIIDNRPYTSIKDFYLRVKPKRQAMITLIKAGAFDNLIDRKLAMAWFLWEVCDKKKRLTLQNMPSLMKYNLLPNISPEMILAKRVYEFNRYLKAVCKVDSEYYRLDTRAFDFLVEIEQEDLIESGNMLSAKLWDKKVYQKHMDVIREYIRENLDELLQQLNDIMFMNEWEKDATGTISTWEMAAMCFYYHEHELANLNMSKYGFRNFSDLPEEPEVDYVFKKGGRDIPIYKLDRICGTVIAKDKNKSLVTLLTTEGVVTVKFRKEFFSLYDKQISVKDDSGVKHVVERSWMNKGRKLAITGHRNGDMFVAKKYAKTPYHTLYLITNVYDNGDIDLKSERATGFEEEADE